MLALLLDGGEECVGVKIYLLAEIVVLVLDFLKSLLLGHVLVRDELVDLRLLLRVDAFFLLV